MAGGYGTPRGDSLDVLSGLVADMRRRLRELERPTGTSLTSLVQQVQMALANLNAQVAAAINANSYTKAVIDDLIANPPAGSNVTGNVVASGNVTAGGQVTSAQPLKSPGSFAYQVTTGYVSAWINNDGQIGFSPSTATVKKDLEEFPADLADAFLALTPYLGRYTWDDEDTPLKVFLLAENTQAAGFGPDVVPVDEDGAPQTINYSQLVVPLLAAVKRQQAQIDALTQQVDTLSGGTL